MGTQLNQRLSDRLGKGTRVQTDKPLGRRMSAPIGKPLVQRLGGAISEWPVYLSMAGQILPLAKAELSRWEQRARQIPNPELRRQAVASICKKSFHSVGGSVFGLMNRQLTKPLVRAIVAIQTISDYLDNLCDRAAFWNSVSGQAGVTRLDDWEAASRGFSCSMQLHEAILCAVDPCRPMSGFYSLYPAGDDGGYLDDLVAASRDVLETLENYVAVQPMVTFFAALYAEMQSIKHLSPEIRETLMEQWFALYSGEELPKGAGIYKLISGWGELALENLCRTGPACFEVSFRRGVSRLKWWEFGAAAGSTLGIFSLISYAARPGCSVCVNGAASASGPGDRPSSVGHGTGRGCAGPTSGKCPGCVGSAYFPWICGLHILLDYFIDQAEDLESGDLNFVSYYDSMQDAAAALNRFTCMSLEKAEALFSSWIHTAVVRGLLAMYLSDPKVKACGLSQYARQLAAQGDAGWLRRMCAAVRRIARI